MRIFILAVVFSLFSSLSCYAQTPIATTNNRFVWDQNAPTLPDAQSYIYRYYLDGAPSGVVFSTVTCIGTISPYQCTNQVPSFTQGTHSITFTAANIAGESLKSSPFGFVFEGVPVVPTNIGLR